MFEIDVSKKKRLYIVLFSFLILFLFVLARNTSNLAGNKNLYSGKQKIKSKTEKYNEDTIEQF